jgi:pilus assembly protein CpaB
MSRRRRGIVLAGLALLLGALAASDVAGREAALRRSVGPLVGVVVAARPLVADRPLKPADLTVRRVPARFAPAGTVGDPRELVGLRLAGAVAAGSDVTPALVDHHDPTRPGAPVDVGERVADVTAVGSATATQPGARVDVLVTRDRSAARAGQTQLALQDVEVLAVRPNPPAPGDRDAETVVASLRVTLHQAVYLAAAQAFARELRLLPRAADDRRHVRSGLVVGDSLAAAKG